MRSLASRYTLSSSAWRACRTSHVPATPLPQPPTHTHPFASLLHLVFLRLERYAIILIVKRLWRHLFCPNWTKTERTLRVLRLLLVTMLAAVRSKTTLVGSDPASELAYLLFLIKFLNPKAEPVFEPTYTTIMAIKAFTYVRGF